MHNVIDSSLMPSITFQAICVLRMVAASICGAIIGYERTQQLKEAGVRTHVLVAMGSCLATVVSKYGFFDVVINESMQVDVSRIASNLLTSIAFLGAGMIFSRNGMIKGLTTAAGIWATAAVGLAMGSGLYFLGAAGTLIVLAIHIIFRTGHYNGGSSAVVHMRYAKEEHIPENLRESIEHRFGCKVMSVDASRMPSGSVHIDLELHFKRRQNKSMLSLDLLEDPHFRGLDM